MENGKPFRYLKSALRFAAFKGQESPQVFTEILKDEDVLDHYRILINEPNPLESSVSIVDEFQSLELQYPKLKSINAYKEFKQKLMELKTSFIPNIPNQKIGLNPYKQFKKDLLENKKPKGLYEALELAVKVSNNNSQIWNEMKEDSNILDYYRNLIEEEKITQKDLTNIIKELEGKFPVELKANYAYALFKVELVNAAVKNS